MSSAPAPGRIAVAAVQMVSGPRLEPNLEQAAALIAQAARRGARLVALPEFFPVIGASDEDRLALREHAGRGPIQDFLAAQARAHGLWLVGGTVPLFGDAPARLRNACLVFDPQGGLAARYDKIHLFGFARAAESYDEARTIEPGNAPVAFDAPCGRVGLAVCYDLRFPELFRALGELALAVVPSAFTATTGRAHWELLLRARAVENQCYVLAPAQGGQHPTGRRTWGHTMLVDPWGEVLDCLPDGPGVVMGEIDPQRLAEVRASLPALRHRVLR